MDIKFLEPDIENFSYLKLEYKGYAIETEVHVMGETALIAYKIDVKLGRQFLRWWVGKEGLSLLLPAMIWGIIFAIDENVDFGTIQFLKTRPIYCCAEYNVWLLEIYTRNFRHQVMNEKIIQHVWMSLETYLPKIKRII